MPLTMDSFLITVSSEKSVSSRMEQTFSILLLISWCCDFNACLAPLSQEQVSRSRAPDSTWDDQLQSGRLLGHWSGLQYRGIRQSSWPHMLTGLQPSNGHEPTLFSTNGILVLGCVQQFQSDQIQSTPIDWIHEAEVHVYHIEIPQTSLK